MNEFNRGSIITRAFFVVVGIIITAVVNLDLYYFPFIAVIVGVVGIMAVAAIVMSRLKSPSRETVIRETSMEFPHRRDDFPRETKHRSSDRIRRFDVVCPDCGYENPSDAQFCIGCGIELHQKVESYIRK